MAAKRLQEISSHILPQVSDTDSSSLPSFDQLPNFKNFTGCAWGVWGPQDHLGTVNILTEKVVQRAAMEEIRCAYPHGFSVARMPTKFWDLAEQGKRSP
jgi:hypothetical protein